MTTRRLAWIDLETTGLHANKGHILEVACVITDNDLGIIEVFDEVVRPPLLVRLFPHRHMDAKVLKMHTDNGLLDECPEGLSPRQCENEFVKFLQPFKNGGDNELYFVGNSIGALDLPFLRRHMPSVMNQVHYRSIDISGLRLGLEQIFAQPNAFYLKAQSDSNHRALDDCYRSIEQLKFYKQKIGEIIQGAIDLEKVRHTF
jgi:oligoribonuclease